MFDEDLIKIKISKVIPAQKWRVIRLLTKVWEFPAHVPFIKEASVVEKTHNRLKTRWRILVDDIPISWIEEDTLVLSEDAICFQAIEGDLEEFKGQWTFKSHPEGTEVTVDVNLKVGVPGIKDFANPYIEKLLTKNLEAILDSLEKRLISTKYSNHKSGKSDKIAGFGIIGHLYNFNHLEQCLKMLNPNFKMPSREFLGQIFNVTPSFKLYDIVDFKSKTGETTSGCFIVATIIPDLIEKDIRTLYSKVVIACKVAEKHGVGLVTLGGFTSIIAERFDKEIVTHVDVPITTGNTFTAAMAIEGVLKAANALDLDLEKAKVTIIGGTGDIGSGCARVLVDKVKEIVVTGRTKRNLRFLRSELKRKRKARVKATTNNKAAAKDADIIIAAASATASFLDIDWFKPGAIICDVGYPKNISYTATNREDILIFSGGLTKSPTPISFPIDLGLPQADTIYGCFAEAIILALEKRYGSFSFGRGNITSEKIQEIKDLGAKHGFQVSDFWWGDKLVDSTMIEKIKQARK